MTEETLGKEIRDAERMKEGLKDLISAAFEEREALLRNEQTLQSNLEKEKNDKIVLQEKLTENINKYSKLYEETLAEKETLEVELQAVTKEMNKEPPVDQVFYDIYQNKDIRLTESICRSCSRSSILNNCIQNIFNTIYNFIIIYLQIIFPNTFRNKKMITINFKIYIRFRRRKNFYSF